VKAWGINFAVGSIQDIFVSEPMRIYIIHILALGAIRPQLVEIKRAITNLCLSVTIDKMDRLHEFRVVQSMSAACRAARSSHIAHLSSAHILRQLDDIDVIACRTYREAWLGYITLFVILVPSIIAIYTSGVADMWFDIYFPSLFSGFVLLNEFLLNISPGVFIIPYLILIAFVAYRYGVFDPSIAYFKEVQEQNRRESIDHLSAEWRASRRRSTRVQIGFHTRLFFNAYDRVSKAIVYIHSIFYPALEDELQLRGTSKEILWSNMNASTYVQGTVDAVSYFVDDLGKYLPHVKSSDSILFGDSTAELLKIIENEVDIPEPILNMRIHYNDIGVARLKSDFVHRVVRANRSQHHIFLTGGVTTVARTALSKLLSEVKFYLDQDGRYLTHSFYEYEALVDHDSSTASKFVAKSQDIYDAFQTMFEYYCPEGHRLDVGDCAELIEMCVEWIACLKTEAHGLGEVVNVEDFEMWFLELFESVNNLIVRRFVID
jgi:hypothetical protein